MRMPLPLQEAQEELGEHSRMTCQRLFLGCQGLRGLSVGVSAAGAPL